MVAVPVPIYFASNGAGYSPLAPSEKAAVLLPADYQADGTRRCVITGHGLLGDAFGAATGWKVGMDELRTFAALGFPCINADVGGPATWGNDTTQTRIGEAFTYMVDTWGCAPDKFCAYGQSQGGPGLLNYMRNHPTNVAAFAGEVAGVGLDDLHDRSAAAPTDPAIGVMAGSIEGAYGGLAAYNAAIATHDPLQNAATHAAQQIPTKLWVSENDPIWPRSIAQQFADAGAAELASLGLIGHSILPKSFYMAVAKFLAPYVFRREPIRRYV